MCGALSNLERLGRLRDSDPTRTSPKETRVDGNRCSISHTDLLFRSSFVRSLRLLLFYRLRTLGLWQPRTDSNAPTPNSNLQLQPTNLKSCPPHAKEKAEPRQNNNSPPPRPPHRTNGPARPRLNPKPAPPNSSNSAPPRTPSPTPRHSPQ